jgi:hypothetical protein
MSTVESHFLYKEAFLGFTQGISLEISRQSSKSSILESVE